mmetsp:Transcript_44907/g.45326  ORF Transcript_44907/g.45326 Transcript_44907/m.45326 type:complete len:90 (+) Transcript_44907:1182-1451(+)
MWNKLCCFANKRSRDAITINKYSIYPKRNGTERSVFLKPTNNSVDQATEANFSLHTQLGLCDKKYYTVNDPLCALLYLVEMAQGKLTSA